MPQEGNTKHACVVRISYTLSRDTTKDWAAQIYKYVQIQAMPPARADIPTRSWSDSQVITFKQWMDNDCPEK